MRKVWKKRDGFTLIELLIVVAIIGILAGIAIPNFLGARNRAKISRVFADFRTIGTALEAYYVDNTEYPSETGGLDALTPDYVTSIPNDPFGTDLVPAYRYYTDTAGEVAGGAWLIVSNGPDGEADVQEPGLSWDGEDRVSGQLGGPDGVYSGYGSDNPDPSDKATNPWYDPTVGAASSGDLGRGGP